MNIAEISFLDTKTQEFVSLYKLMKRLLLILSSFTACLLGICGIKFLIETMDFYGCYAFNI